MSSITSSKAAITTRTTIARNFATSQSTGTITAISCDAARIQVTSRRAWKRAPRATKM